MGPEPMRVSEIDTGVFYSGLPQCTPLVLGRILAERDTWIWLVEHWPQRSLTWQELPVPLSDRGDPTRVLVRDLQYDLQLSAKRFLDLLPLWTQSSMIALEMARPVPDALRYRELKEGNNLHRVLKQNGWLMTFELPVPGDFAELTLPDKERLEGILADLRPIAGELP